MIETTRGDVQTGADILRFQIRVIPQDGVRTDTGRQQVKHIRHANAHPPYTGLSTTEAGRLRDPRE